MNEVVQIVCSDGTDVRVEALQTRVRYMSLTAVILIHPYQDQSSPRAKKTIICLSKELLDDFAALDYLDTLTNDDVLFVFSDDELLVPLGFVAPVIDWRISKDGHWNSRRLEWIENWIAERPVPQSDFASTTTESLFDREQRRRVFAAYEPVISALSGAVAVLTIPFIAYAVLAVSRFRISESDDFYFGGLVNLSGLGILPLIPMGVVYLVEYCNLALSHRRLFLPTRDLQIWAWTTLRVLVATALGVSVALFSELSENEMKNAEVAGLTSILIIKAVLASTLLYAVYGLGLALFRLRPLLQKSLSGRKVFSLTIGQ